MSVSISSQKKAQKKFKESSLFYNNMKKHVEGETIEGMTDETIFLQPLDGISMVDILRHCIAHGNVSIANGLIERTYTRAVLKGKTIMDSQITPSNYISMFVYAMMEGKKGSENAKEIAKKMITWIRNRERHGVHPAELYSSAYLNDRELCSLFTLDEIKYNVKNSDIIEKLWNEVQESTKEENE